jgi:hypothetical protein
MHPPTPRHAALSFLLLRLNYVLVSNRIITGGRCGIGSNKGRRFPGHFNTIFFLISWRLDESLISWLPRRKIHRTKARALQKRERLTLENRV